jgi:hypothetical protein
LLVDASAAVENLLQTDHGLRAASLLRVRTSSRRA